MAHYTNYTCTVWCSTQYNILLSVSFRRLLFLFSIFHFSAFCEFTFKFKFIFSLEFESVERNEMSRIVCKGYRQSYFFLGDALHDFGLFSAALAARNKKREMRNECVMLEKKNWERNERRSVSALFFGNSSFRLRDSDAFFSLPRQTTVFIRLNAGISWNCISFSHVSQTKCFTHTHNHSRKHFHNVCTEKPDGTYRVSDCE